MVNGGNIRFNYNFEPVIRFDYYDVYLVFSCIFVIQVTG